MSGYIAHVVVYLLLVLPATFFLVTYGFLSEGRMIVSASILIGCFYAVLPDIDEPSSKVRSLLGKVFLGVSLACLLGFLAGLLNRNAIYVPVVLIFSLYVLWYVKHRGVLHTLLAGLLFSAPLIFVKPIYGAYAFVGFSTHLMLDRKIFR